MEDALELEYWAAHKGLGVIVLYLKIRASAGGGGSTGVIEPDYSILEVMETENRCCAQTFCVRVRLVDCDSTPHP